MRLTCRADVESLQMYRRNIANRLPAIEALRSGVPEATVFGAAGKAEGRYRLGLSSGAGDA